MARRLVQLLSLLLFAVSAQAQTLNRAKLSFEPINGPGCVDKTFIAQGQQVRITGTQFDPGQTVDLKFSCCGGNVANLGSTSADGTGAIDFVVVVPAVTNGWPMYPNLGRFQAIGATPIYVSGSETALIGPPTTSDTDGDGVPDFCDNCPSDSNPDQFDLDADGLGDFNPGGNSCDPCGGDAENDADGDGLCESGAGLCPHDPNNDIDGDDICGDVDNCPLVANVNQEDIDNNGIGDACQTQPTCSDGVDNDDDGIADYPSDTGCSDANDTTETDPADPCDDGIDNDADGLTDADANGISDPGCGKYLSLAISESPACNDHIDNDGDGLIDFDGDLGLTDPDPGCDGFGFGTSEVVPEPGVATSLALGSLLLSGFQRRLRIRRTLLPAQDVRK